MDYLNLVGGGDPKGEILGIMLILTKEWVKSVAPVSMNTSPSGICSSWILIDLELFLLFFST